MAAEVNLSGQHVLVVENEYYLAREITQVIESAGARVIGPCSTTRNALDLLYGESPTIASVDINLGAGPCYEVASTLRARGIPFVFATGYDREAISAQFADVPHVQKPIELRKLVGVLAAQAAAGLRARVGEASRASLSVTL